MWINKTQADKVAQTAYFGDIKSYLFHQFFNTFKVDVSIASCTGMMNVNTCDWDDQALELANVDRSPITRNCERNNQAIGLTAAAQSKMGIPADTPFVYGALTVLYLI